MEKQHLCPPNPMLKPMKYMLSATSGIQERLLTVVSGSPVSYFMSAF